jgi:cerevisin
MFSQKFAIVNLLFYIPFVFGNYLLTPKPYVNNILFDVESFNNEHNVEHFVTINTLNIFKTNENSMNMFKDTLSMFYHIEREQEFSIRKHNNNQYSFALKEESESDIPWHLGRIVANDLPLNKSFTYDKCHNNENIDIHTYVIDTGIDVSHPEFEGRATWSANFIDNKDYDCQSHGTHCAGLIGSKTYGSCKDAKLFAVKVLDCRGSGSTSSVISGIEYAFKRHQEENIKSGGKTRSIVSMSLGGSYSYTLNKAVQETLKDPYFYFAAAAGNEDQDACKTSPASVKEIFTVMASDVNDARAYFSNYGKCADIYSPGVNIESTVPNKLTAIYSGTSMATPILVGVLNHYIDQNPELSMKQLKKLVLKSASKSKINNNPRNTNNLLVYLERD